MKAPPSPPQAGGHTPADIYAYERDSTSPQAGGHTPADIYAHERDSTSPQAGGGGMQLRIFMHTKEILPPACGGARGGLGVSTFWGEVGALFLLPSHSLSSLFHMYSRAKWNPQQLFDPIGEGALPQC